MIKRLFRRRKPRRWKWFIFLLCLTGLLAFMELRVRPTVEELAASQASNVVVEEINRTINAKILSGEIDYSSIISFEKDNDGKITALKTNMGEVNRLKTNIVADVIANIEDASGNELKVPLGNVINGTLFSGFGPEVKIRIVAINSLHAEFRNSFSDSGINQTLHRIYIDITAMIKIVFSGRAIEVEVSETVPAAETVLVGMVPDSYTYFEDVLDTDEAMDKYFNYG